MGKCYRTGRLLVVGHERFSHREVHLAGGFCFGLAPLRPQAPISNWNAAIRSFQVLRDSSIGLRKCELGGTSVCVLSLTSRTHRLTRPCLARSTRFAKSVLGAREGFLLPAETAASSALGSFARFLLPADDTACAGGPKKDRMSAMSCEFPADPDHGVRIRDESEIDLKWIKPRQGLGQVLGRHIRF